MVLFEDPRTLLSMHVTLEERAWEFDKTGDAYIGKLHAIIGISNPTYLP